jgi:hypothetical protein
VREPRRVIRLTQFSNKRNKAGKAEHNVRTKAGEADRDPVFYDQRKTPDDFQSIKIR